MSGRPEHEIPDELLGALVENRMATSARGLVGILGVSKSTVHRAGGKHEAGDRVVGLDGKSYPATRVPLGPSEELRRLREQGWSYRRIAAEFGVSHQTVMRLLSRGPGVPNGTGGPAGSTADVSPDAVQVSQTGQVDQEPTA